MKRVGTGVFAFLGMLILILDTKTAILGATDGLELCIRTVIPSLFPFFLLSILLTSSLSGSEFAFLRPLGRRMGLPGGSESLFLIGLLGGYPTGAASVSQCFRDGLLSKTDAKRMLGFCSNAGPSFLFGIAAAQLGNVRFAWILWFIHIASAVITGCLLPGKSTETVKGSAPSRVSVTEALARSLRIMAGVCGWIILFRVVLAFLIRWFLWILPSEIQVTVMGVLELTIGCTQLGGLAFPWAFLICSGLLSFGGICVLLQTASVTGGLGLGMYFPGKLLQTAASILLSACYLKFLCRESIPLVWILIPGILLFSVFFAVRIKLGVAIQNKLLYNQPIKKGLVIGHVIPKKS